MDVGFIGLGRMGRGMARNIAAAGHRVRAWNRSPVEPIAGVEMVASPADALRADAAFTMLADDAAIRQVVLRAGLLDAAPRDLVHIVTATISVDFAGELAEGHQAAGIAYVSAPVFGRPDAADAGHLNVVAGGPDAAIAKVQPLFDAIGQRTFRTGEDPRSANTVKIAGNMLIAMTIEALGEAAAITESHGVSRDAFFDIMLNTLFGCRAYQNYSREVSKGQHEPGFTLTLGRKDVRLATEAAPGGKAMPMLSAVREQMDRAIEAGLGDRDWSALAKYTLES